MAEQALKGTLEETANQQNHYAENLAEVNKSTDVIATQDIYNENGLLVAAKGTNINHEVSDLIVQQKLVQPLEEQVQLEKALNSNGMKGLSPLWINIRTWDRSIPLTGFRRQLIVCWNSANCIQYYCRN